jgi:pimeloyl-ACP methyl ester carboxylesterase
MNSRKKFFIGAIILIALALLSIPIGNAILNNTVQGYYREAEQFEAFEGVHSTFGYTRIRASDTLTEQFLLRDPSSVRFVLWSKGRTGTFRLSILDADGRIIRTWQGRDTSQVEEIPLQPGTYTVELVFARYSGSLRFGLSDGQFIATLPPDRYTYIESDPSAGFHWDYILYTPEKVTSPYLLVIPNNTGYEENDMAFHQAAAKSLIRGMSGLADDLGTPLLVPVFPRPAGELTEYYTHNLDRDVLLMTRDGYRRLDLQLLAMVEDARVRLDEKRIQTDERFLLWGFSASGTFSDRFSLLHPDRLKAVASCGTHSLPFATYAGENLPYPVGTYDYETITGAPFDADAFASLPRFLFIGDQDQGGTFTTDDGTVYPMSEYFDLFLRPDLEARNASSPVPLVTGFEMVHWQEDLIKFRIYHGAGFVDEFIAISRIYAAAGLDNSQFKIYPGVGHQFTDAMLEDVRQFFETHIR